jgi:uncharacterized lipoprotein YddW (UPF0748 family)
MMVFTFLFAIHFCFTAISFSQSPKFETRAVWLSTASGDWPTSTNPDEQKRSLIKIFDNLRELKFNTVFFQVRPRGNTMYHSVLEPWATQLTGILGRDPGYDPLEFAIEEAHTRGLELHAWFNVAKVFAGDAPPSHPQHLVRTHPEWLRKVENEWWMDMGIPAARDYTQELVMELVRNYDLDGIHFDYIRYPGSKFDDWGSFREYSNGMERNEWRRENITLFVRNCYERINKEKPYLKVGSAPLGIYQSMDGAQSSFTGIDGVFQDARAWLREGIQDYIAPQLYWSFGEQRSPYDPDFAILCNDWARERYGRNVFAGIGAYQENVRSETAEQIRFSRDVNMQGQSIFRYENISQIRDELLSAYRFRALCSPMPWKDAVPPPSPSNISVSYGDDNLAVIRWTAPEKDRDGKLPMWFVVYRSSEEQVNTTSPGTILAVVPASQTVYRDESVRGTGRKNFYTVTSLDRCGNESNGIKQQKSEARTLLSRYRQRRSMVNLSENYPNPFSQKTFISFDLPERSFVTLKLIPSDAQKETTIIREMREAGTHIVGINGATLQEGMIEVQLRVGTTVVRKMIEKR